MWWPRWARPRAPAQLALGLGEEPLGRFVGAGDDRHGPAASRVIGWPIELVEKVGRSIAKLLSRTRTHPNARLLENSVTAAATEGTGVYRLAPYVALEDCGIEPELFHVQHAKQIKDRKTGYNDSVWLSLHRVVRLGAAELRAAVTVPPAAPLPVPARGRAQPGPQRHLQGAGPGRAAQGGTLTGILATKKRESRTDCWRDRQRPRS